jgi:hypothetical protein
VYLRKWQKALLKIKHLKSIFKKRNAYIKTNKMEEIKKNIKELKLWINQSIKNDNGVLVASHQAQLKIQKENLKEMKYADIIYAIKKAINENVSDDSAINFCVQNDDFEISGTAKIQIGFTRGMQSNDRDVPNDSDCIYVECIDSVEIDIFESQLKPKKAIRYIENYFNN